MKLKKHILKTIEPLLFSSLLLGSSVATATSLFTIDINFTGGGCQAHNRELSPKQLIFGAI